MEKISFQLINLLFFLSSIIIEMSSVCLKFETYRYKRVNDMSYLNENDEDKRMVIIFSFDTFLCNLISKPATVACQFLVQ